MLFQFPSPVVYWEQLPEHADIKDYLMEYIHDDAEHNGERYREKLSWECDITSSFFRDQPLEFMTQELYNTIVWNPLQRFYGEAPSQTNLMAFAPELQSFWYNVSQPGQYQETHTHNSSYNSTIISGIYLLHVDEPNPTIFMDSNPSWCASAMTVYNTEHFAEGSVILFPSDLLHSVKPSSKMRTTISFNISVKQ